jgi:hypothetical protein
MASFCLSPVFAEESTQATLQQEATSIGECFGATKTQIPLKSSRLNETYQAYKITIQNDCAFPVEVINAQAASATSGLSAYHMVKKSSASVWGSVLGAGFVLSIVTFGISFVVALVAWPIIAGVNGSKNATARKESMKFTDIVPIGLMNTGESVEMLSLFPIGQKPQLKFTMKQQNAVPLYTVSR